MSFAAPNRDFKVVYYDKYTGTSITHVLTVLGYQYFIERKDLGEEIEKMLNETPVYVVTAAKKEYMWFPVRAAKSLYGIKQTSNSKMEDVIPDHMAAVQLVLDSISQKTEKKATDNDITVVYNDGDFIIYHAKTFKAFATIGTPAWYPGGEAEWNRIMKLYSNRVYVLHMGDQTTANGVKFAIVTISPTAYHVFDNKGKPMPGSNFHLPVREALDAFNEKLLLTA